MVVPNDYLEDASGYRGSAERLFVPAEIGEIVRIIKEARRKQAPLTVSGARTGITGGSVAHGGWVLSTEKLKRLEVGEGRAVAEAGVLLSEIHQAAGAAGQFYPPDPTETAASLGGTIATNASGSRSFRYGSTVESVLRCRAVFADGEIREFRRGEQIDFPVPKLHLPATTKNTAGYRLRPAMDWIDLLCGSEGTLAIVVEAELRLLPLPRRLITGVVFFPENARVLDAVEKWRPLDGLRMMEYFDRASLGMLRSRFPDIPATADGALLVEQEPAGPEEDEVDRWIDRLDEAGADLEGSWFASGPRDRERFRLFRHALPESVNNTVRANGFLKLNSDFAVPLDRNREMLGIYQGTLAREFPGRHVIFGHIGDAHVHVNILSESNQDFERGTEVLRELAAEAVRMGGTVSAEHGLGKRKAGYLSLQYAPDEIRAMREVKQRLDPERLLGRGTLFPEDGY